MHKPEFSSSEQTFPGILGGKGPSAPELRLRLSPLVYSAHAHTLDTRRRISEYQETDSDPELDKQIILSPGDRGCADILTLTPVKEKNIPKPEAANTIALIRKVCP